MCQRLRGLHNKPDICNEQSKLDLRAIRFTYICSYQRPKISKWVCGVESKSELGNMHIFIEKIQQKLKAAKMA